MAGLAGMLGLVTDLRCRLVKVECQKLGTRSRVAGIHSPVQKVSVSLVSLRSTAELEIYKEEISRQF